MRHHEEFIWMATGGSSAVWWLGAGVVLNAKTMWRWCQRQLSRFAPKPPAVHSTLTIAELVRIQPEIDEYVTALAAQGAPYTTLAALIRELNGMALSTSALKGALNTARFRLDEVACLLRNTEDHEALPFKARSARKLVDTLISDLTPES